MTKLQKLIYLLDKLQPEKFAIFFHDKNGESVYKTYNGYDACWTTWVKVEELPLKFQDQVYPQIYCLALDMTAKEIVSKLKKHIYVSSTGKNNNTYYYILISEALDLP